MPLAHRRLQASCVAAREIGTYGGRLVQILGALVLSCVMFCFCTLLLTFAKAMILRWVGVVMPENQAQMPLLERGMSDETEEWRAEGDIVDMYSF